MPTIRCSFCDNEKDYSTSKIARGARYCSHACYIAEKLRKRGRVVPEGSWRCGRCELVKPQNEFYTHGKRNGYAGWCKMCRCEDERARRGNMALVQKFHDKYETDMSFRARELLRAIGKRCRLKRMECDLDIEWLSKRLSGVCELTGLPFNRSVKTRKSNPYTPSVDRINSKRGYTKDNCRVVLLSVNIALQHWGLETILPVMAALVKEREKADAA